MIDKQIELEVNTVNTLHEKLTKNALKAQKNAKKTNNASSLPNGVKFTERLYEELLEFVELFVKLEFEKKRKSTFYINILKPCYDQYEVLQAGFFTKDKVSHPNKIIAWNLATGLSSVLVRTDTMRKATAIAKDACRAVKASLCMGFEISNSELAGMIQFLRTYTDMSSLVYEGRLPCKTVVIKPTAEYADLISNTDTLHEIVATKIDHALAYKPMIVEPLDHTDLVSGKGGYLVTHSPLMKNPDYKNGVYTCNESLITTCNLFQKTEWQVDKDYFNWLNSFGFDFMDFNTDELTVKQIQRANELAPVIRELTNDLYQLRKTRKDADEADKGEYLTQCKAIEKQIKVYGLELKEFESVIGKLNSFRDTLNIATEFVEYDKFYLPIFLDYRGRVFTYCTNLSFQSNNLSKSLIGLANKERLTEEGYKELVIALGTCFKGYDKKKYGPRKAVVKENLDGIFALFEKNDTSILDMIDKDEIYMAMRLMYELYHHLTNPEYKTGVLTYIDSCSSAIQIQGLLQHDKKAATLTNIIECEGNKLADAYMAVSDACKSLISDLSSDTDFDLLAKVTTYVNLNQPNRVF